MKAETQTNSNIPYSDERKVVYTKFKPISENIADSVIFWVCPS